MKIISTDLFFRPPLKVKPKPKMIENWDYYSLSTRLKKQLGDEADRIVTGPKANRLLKHISVALILALAGMIGVNLIVLAVR